MLYDAHNHLQDAWLAPHRVAVFRDLAAIPLRAAVVNGTSETDWNDVTALAREHPFVIPSYGLHPWHVGNASASWRQRLLAELDRNPGAAIGEVGLDRWILDRARPDDPRLTGLRRANLDEQREAFAWQLALATARNLPITIHCLDAWGPLADVLRRQPVPARGFLLHAYGGSAEMARTFAALGGYFSFSGCFLGARQSAKREVFKALPADRVLVETDAPAMPPPPNHRAHSLPDLPDGSPINHPANIAASYAGLAAVLGTSRAELEHMIAENFLRFFGPLSRARGT